jgi:SAM-dependent methyltransferase
VNVQPNGSCQSYLTRIRQRLQGLGADQMVLQPFMARSHYLQNFDFQPYARRPEPDYSPATWEHHYWLFELYKHEYGFFLPTAELMDRLVGFLQAEIGPAGRVLDAGSGSGFLSKELCRRGIDTFAVDRCAYEDQKVQRQFGYPMITVYQRDAMGDAVNHVSRQFGAVLLVWPPYDKSFAFDIAKAMHPGQLLIFEGEGAGGCAGDDKFFEYVSDGEQWLALKELSDQLDAVHVTFAPQHDHWFIWRKFQQ